MAQKPKKNRAKLSAETTILRPVAAQNPDSSAVALLAYEFWQARGCPEGSPEIDWFRAEQKLAEQSAKRQSSSMETPSLTSRAGA